MGYSIGLDYFIILFTLVITIGSSAYIKHTYIKTKKIESKKNMNGFETAKKILNKNGLENVTIDEVAVDLADHYDPRNKVVTISTDVYRKASLASISVAAHECGHALQDKEGYVFLKIRRKIVPIVNLASSLGYVAIMIGLFAGLLKFLWLGILLEVIILMFQLITLPVEFNASHRALIQIKELGIVEEDEIKYCKKMLRAAALTYVASVATSILEILRLVLIARRDD